MPSERIVTRLRDIVEDANRIETFVAGMSLDDFIASERTIFAVERLLQRITEAAVQIGHEEAARIGLEMPIDAMRALGNRLRHEYRDINRDVIFEIARIEVPALRYEAELALESDH